MADMFYNNLKEPPTSTVMLESCQFCQVIFANIEKFYVPGTDITCYYNLSRYFMPRKKDWVGIFRVGWKTTREYFTFMWAPKPRYSETGYAEPQQVVFKAYYLPKDDEYYQFCYVDQDGQINGTSVPFQFRTETNDDILIVTKEGEVEKIQQQNAMLLQENKNLKKNLANLQEQNMHLQEELVAAKVLQDKVNTLENKCEKLESQMTDLEKEKYAIKDDLMQIKEEKESVLSEKEKMGNQLKTTLCQKEEFQLQVQIQKKEMDNLQETIKDKAKHLKEWKGENYQLNAALFRQQMLNKIQEEQTLALQILKKQKDELHQEKQKLWQENEDLKATTPEIRSSSAGLPSQSPPNSGLLFENPYSASPKIVQTNPVSLKKCPICQEVFPNDIGQQQYLDHVQNHILDCPYCNKTFDSSDKQVYDDHVFCHRLDQA
ncbi:calcium-binding and coiled-coil domain-containing protein 2 [Notechis scutatus]|uniref:Calcium-binding and coiled-coil domain-containing protein 2 n=1 Tax=Notechis scutatus TaxID=8663 RepID=A0A6J1UAN6_9SAUR|nr:calcium-binding and coiled-coil domain-containing protein 2 [Notechis scutatus]